MKIATALIAALLSGCASMPADAPRFSRAPAPTAGESNIYIYRDGAYPKMRTPSIVIDGIKVFDPPEKSYTVVSLPPGVHKFVVDWSWDTGWPDLEFPLQVVPGASMYIKISGSFEHKGYDYRGTLFEAGSLARIISASEAEAELAACCRYIAPRRRN